MEKVAINMAVKFGELDQKTQKKVRVALGVTTRETIYNELTVQFFGITRALDDEKKTELDGLLWDVALRLVEV